MTLLSFLTGAGGYGILFYVDWRISVAVLLLSISWKLDGMLQERDREQGMRAVDNERKGDWE